MFHSALIRTQSVREQSFDAGTFAETLLFYRNVHIVLDGSFLHQILVSIGSDNFLGLIKAKRVTATYSRTMSCVYHEVQNSISEYAFTAISRAKPHKNRQLSASDDVEIIIERTLGKSKQTKLLTKRLIDEFAFRDTKLGNCDNSIDVINSELLSLPTLRSYISVIISELAPTFCLPSDFSFEVLPKADESGKFYVFSNIDYDRITEIAISNGYPLDLKVTPELLLSHILDTKIDADLASRYSSELVTSTTKSRLLQIKFQHILQRRSESAREPVSNFVCGA
jgi:hypothetical protein